MGRPIQTRTTVLGDVLVLEGDRAITGQDGTSYADRAQAEVDGRFEGRLAVALFDADEDIDHLFVASNHVVARRRGGWTGEAGERLEAAVSGFFVHYR